MKPKIVVFGCGRWAKNHIRELNEMKALYGVCDISTEALESVHYEKAKKTNNAEEVWTTWDFDACVIATPPNTHYEIAKRGLQEGKHVFIEKPMTVNTAEAEELRNMKGEKQILMVGHILQFHPCVLRLKEELKTVKSVEYIHLRRCNLGPIHERESILWNLGPHDLSLAVGLATCCGFTEIASVSLSESIIKYKGQNDVCNLHLTFKNPDTGKILPMDIYESRIAPVKESTVWVVCEECSYVFDDTQQYYWDKLQKIRPSVPTKQFKKEISSILSPEEAVDFLSPLVIEIDVFLKAIKTGVEPEYCSSLEGVQVVRLIEEAYKNVTH